MIFRKKVKKTVGSFCNIAENQEERITAIERALGIKPPPSCGIAWAFVDARGNIKRFDPSENGNASPVVNSILEKLNLEVKVEPSKPETVTVVEKKKAGK
jgi:hypothetical protein